MVAVTTAITLGAAAYSAYNQYKAGKAEKERAAEVARLNDIKAEELLARAHDNAEQLRFEGDQAAANAIVASASGEGLSMDLVSMSALNRKVTEAQDAMIADATWEAEQIQAGADMTREAGAIAESGAGRQAFGTLLSGIGNAVYSEQRHKLATEGTERKEK